MRRMTAEIVPLPSYFRLSTFDLLLPVIQRASFLFNSKFCTFLIVNLIMKKISTTYRLLALVTAVSFFAGFILPSVLHAHGLISDLCAMESEMDMPEKGEHCDLESHAGAPVSHHHSEAEAGECELDLTCACNTEEAPVKPEAVTITDKTQVLPATSDIAFATERNASKILPKAGTTVLNTSPPPIFLLVSSFLN